ncbi:hypothetical protein HC931_03295 [Candidatus Gracilibacteria bacterium]|jgi:hypothetical protein|nr:hypothetical protein [Candidatus Gracilibacteria bacterium]NJM86597.1 hypothetical protein [Hydrococcus sp. RU_2_2]NJP22335.1 hypothetical protein [Hydrococcus sp. CRU_1_1]
MNGQLADDASNIDYLLGKTRDRGVNFLQSLNERPVSVLPPPYEIESLCDRGIGAERETNNLFNFIIKF